MENPYQNLSAEALDTCVRRMARTLASKPRNPKLRGYLISLNARERKTAAQIEAELRAQARAAEIMAEEKAQRAVESKKRFEARVCAARRVIALAGAETTREIRRVRKQRISPLAPKSERPHPLKHCRRESRFQPGLTANEPRQSRGMEEMKALRAALYEAQDGVCGICGQDMDATKKNSLDHVIPRSRLVREDGNYVLAHGECNGDKTNDVPTGCEMVFLLMVNAKLGLHPQVF